MNRKKKISIEKIVEKTSHNVADLFQIKERGYIREGYFADIVLFDLDSKTDVNVNNILSKCSWSPFENTSFNSKVIHTIVSGNHIYKNGEINGEPSGLRMEFNRD
jgi:dihydroorotase